MANTDVTLTNCDREPIHIPGQIQPFGALLASHLPVQRLDFASANLSDVLGLSSPAQLGMALPDLLPETVIHDVRNHLTVSTSTFQRERVGIYEIGAHHFELYTHRNGDDFGIIEFEQHNPLIEGPRDTPLDLMRRHIALAGTRPTVDQMLKSAVIGLRQITGYDRVMAYRYLADGSGEVVAEALKPGVDSFLGLRYPAWDVPQQARALQVRNPLRMLVDVHQEPIPLLAARDDASPLDMSLAHLRGISPIHVKYLANMGVGATLTLGIIVDGALWGMLSCHHTKPKVISSDARIAAELFAQMLSLLVKEKQEHALDRARQRSGEARHALLASTTTGQDILDDFDKFAPVFRALIDCDGMALTNKDQVMTTGSVPDDAVIKAIAGQDDWDEFLIRETDHLAEEGWHGDGDLKDTAGCIVIRAVSAHPLQLLFFRDTVETKVTWAGKPEKTLEPSLDGDRLQPRASFSAYIEEQKDRATPWNAVDRETAEQIQVLLGQLSSKNAQIREGRMQALVDSNRKQELLIAELNHRVKNSLALIKSLSRRARDSATSLESYARALEQRISALSTAHDLAVASNMSGVSLKSIIETELNAHVQADSQQVLMDQSEVGLRAEVAPMVALVMHEVITNAVKYGALSVKDGVVQIRWSETKDGLQFSWRELGGPPVSAPERQGFGHALIENTIPYELGGTAQLEFPQAGVTFSFTLPTKHLTEPGEAVAKAPSPGTVTPLPKPADGLNILVVEDSLVIAMDMVESLTGLGANDVQMASTVAEAMVALDSGDIDLAVLDINLGGTLSYDVAERLKNEDIPLIFVSGYGETVQLPPPLSAFEVVSKPITDGLLAEKIYGLAKLRKAGTN